MGHAFGATGAILVGACVDELVRSDGRYGVAAVSGAPVSESRCSSNGSPHDRQFTLWPRCVVTGGG